MSVDPTASTPLGRPLLVALLTTGVSVVASYGLPPDYQALGVAAAFLGATYWMTVRGDDSARIRHYGVALGGVVEPEPLDYVRITRDLWVAVRWATLLALLAFPPFWLGYVLWWGPVAGYTPRLPPALANEILGQLLLIALPEEAFYRGYLQTACDDALGTRWRILGARVGPGLLLVSALFALGHLATQVHPNRLAVFFPSLVFGWLRARTGGIGASILFHAACNLFALLLQHGYGLAR